MLNSLDHISCYLRPKTERMMCSQISQFGQSNGIDNGSMNEQSRV